MATTTTNYGLKKPEETDFYNIADFNENMDKIDSEMALKSSTGKPGTGTQSEIFNDLPVNDSSPHNSADGDYAHAEGKQTHASGNYSHAEGYDATARGIHSHAGGHLCSSNGDSSFAHGNQVGAYGDYTAVFGQGSQASGPCMVAIGKFNKNTQTDSLLEIGMGVTSARANAFRIDNIGKVYAQGAYSNTGADYAEMFEWEDGNTNNKDRCGLFVTLDGDKIRLATAEDTYVLGIVSSTPGVVGNNYGDQWQGMYETDLWGNIVIGDDGNPVINVNYDPDQVYIPRENRKEWGCVGLMGQLIVIDDGTCTVNGYCKVGANCVATASESGYRVMKRIDDTHILVMFR